MAECALYQYRRKCSCPSVPNNTKIITAPPPPKLIPKSTIGISVFVRVLISKFLYAESDNLVQKKSVVALAVF